MQFCYLLGVFVLLTLIFLLEADQNAPKLWLGTAPFCAASYRECFYFGMSFVRWSRSGNGGSCWTGWKVLCQAKEKTELPRSTDQYKLTVMSYKVNNIPQFFGHNGQRERSCHIPREILKKIPDVDVLLIQSSFNAGCFGELTMRDLLRYYGFEHQTESLGVPVIFPRVLDSGIFIASRWPIDLTRAHVFEEYESSDPSHIYSKGVLYARITKLHRVFNIFNTDLHSGHGRSHNRVRDSQIRQIHQFMLQQHQIKQSEAVILGGGLQYDWNHSEGRLERLLNITKLTLPHRIVQLPDYVNSTWSPQLNDLVTKIHGHPAEWTSYVVYSSNYLRPANSTIKAVRLRPEDGFNICTSAPMQPIYVFATSPLCASVDHIRDLSPHYPVVGEFFF